MEKQKLKCLSCDDSRVIRNLVKMGLAQLQDVEIEFFEAENGEDGFKVLQENPDMAIAFLDIHMPKLTGIELVEKIRENDMFNRLKIVMATAEKSREVITGVAKRGINAYIQKPFTQEKVAATAQSILDRLNHH